MNMADACGGVRATAEGRSAQLLSEEPDGAPAEEEDEELEVDELSEEALLEDELLAELDGVASLSALASFLYDSER
jgi:hypothetical protein